MAIISKSTTNELICPHCRKKQESKNWKDNMISYNIYIKYCDFCGYKFYWHSGMWSSVYSWWNTTDKKEKLLDKN